MTFSTVPILGWRDRPERALILDSATGATYELLEPEAPPLPGPRIDLVEAAGRAQPLIEAAIEVALANTTQLHPALRAISEHASLVDALEAADTMLTGPTRRVRRTDLDPAERNLLTDVRRRLHEVQTRLSSLESVPLGRIPAEVEATRSLIDTVRSWIHELETRELASRDGTAVNEGVVRRSAFTPVHALGLPTTLVNELQQREVYTLEDIASHEDGATLPTLEPQHRQTLDEALTDAGLRRPEWLLHRPTEDVAADRTPPVPGTIGQEAARPAPTKDVNGRPLSGVHELSSATRRLLKESGIQTVEQLGTLTATELGQLSGIGKVRKAEIRKALAAMGLRLRSGRGKSTPEGREVAGGVAPRDVSADLPKAPGYGVLTRLTAKGFGFLQTPQGRTLFVNQTELDKLGVQPSENMTLHFRRVEAGPRNPAARQVSLAVPNVRNLSYEDACDLLWSQGFEVVEDTADRRIWMPSNWSVDRQSPQAGSRCRPGARVTIYLVN